jgi:hypothetical protein
MKPKNNVKSKIMNNTNICEHKWENFHEIKLPLLKKCARCGQTYIVKGIKDITCVIECCNRTISNQSNQSNVNWQFIIEYSSWM